MDQPITARGLDIRGIVQGVGFRPRVFQLARKYQLEGTVANTAAGVVIHVQGRSSAIDAFQHDLVTSPPPLALIADVKTFSRPLADYRTFTIVESDDTTEKSALISPDTAVCDDCRREMFDPADRRFRYPFINCTNCGPRYTIIADVPYDRPCTAMHSFTMCPDCQAEYDDPADRRFHAQPNACPKCGPVVTLYDAGRRVMAVDDSIRKTIKLLMDGYIVAIKGLGGFHLAVDATNEDAVIRLRRKKSREEKPLAVMAADLETVHRFARVADEEAAVLTSIQRPIVLLEKRSTEYLAPGVAPRSLAFGVMLAYAPLHYLLLDGLPKVLVMTSGNRTDTPMAVDNGAVFDELTGIADYFLLHDRDIYHRCDDSLVRYTAGDVRPLRRARGYVPVPVFLHQTVPPILAVGAEMKNTICLTKADRAFVSQHLGDLEDVETYQFFTRTIDHLARIFDIQPEIVAHDMHPDYLSSGYARKMTDVVNIAVQHHHAHIVSVMAENHLEGPVIGLAFDGTGYGSDGHIWGGEILVTTPGAFDRAAHLTYVPMPGSAVAIREPWRMAVSYLDAAFGDEIRNLSIPFVTRVDPARVDMMRTMIRNKLNTPQTSSLGRLFDGVAALAGVRQQVTFEGQAAMELEALAIDTDETYPYEWERKNNVYQIRPESIIRGIVADLLAAVPVAEIAGRFHTTLIRMFADGVEQISRDRQIKEVVLSGGVFQNDRLFTGLTRALYDRGMNVYTHRILPANDGGICLGQAMVAAARFKKGFTQ